MTEKLGTLMTQNDHGSTTKPSKEKPPSEKKTNEKFSLKRWLPLIGLVGAVIAAFASGVHKHLSLTAFAENRDFLTHFVSENLLLAVLAYLGIYALATTLSLPGGALLTLVGGFLFGWLIAGSLTVFAATAGAVFVFMIARSSLGAFLTQKAGPFVQKLADGFNDDAFNYMMFLRLVPIFPFWLVNIAPALFNVKMRTYIITTFIGIIPGTFAIALLGSGLGSVIDKQKAIFDTCVAQKGAENCTFNVEVSSLITPQLLAAFAALGVVSLIPVAIKRWKARSNSTAT